MQIKLNKKEADTLCKVLEQYQSFVELKLVNDEFNGYVKNELKDKLMDGHRLASIVIDRIDEHFLDLATQNFTLPNALT